MKRSEINSIILRAKDFMNAKQFVLPPWGYWAPEDWKARPGCWDEIAANGLGWDITDFGLGDFGRYGLVLFTIRNGNLQTGHPKPYAEKIMIVEEEQETPLHFHWHKMEDIINRGGGNLVLELFNATDDDGLGDDPVIAQTDAMPRTLNAGEKLVLKPGESITLPPRLYHRFYGEAGAGTVLVGEVSQVNDDDTDNRFFDELGRFPDIEEDEPPVHLLCKDYASFLS